VFFGWFIRLIEIRAVFVLGFWILVQLASGLLTWGAQVGGVAWFAHVGGFVAGLVLVLPLRRREAQSEWEGRAL
jgi:membrane associated rhomboid family serine protease